MWTSNPKKTWLCLTNNAAERALRGFALGRKSWLFACSYERGADRAAAMTTLIMTAKLNDIAATDKCRIGRLKQRVKAHCAGEIVRRSPTRWLGADTFDFHSSILLCPPASAGDPAVVDKAGEPVPPLEQVVDRLDDRGRARHSGSFVRSHASRAARRGVLCSWRTRRRSSALRPLMSRSISNSASMRLTASSATGEIAVAVFPRRALAAMSASSKNCRLAWAQHSAAVIAP